MVRVEITESLFEEVEKKFRKEASEIYDLMESLKESLQKGKSLGTVGGIVIKEIKYKSFRFYFIADGFKLKMIAEEEIVDLLLRFIRMSDKKRQQETIDEIKQILVKIGPEGFK